jgi:hypothetical protein
VKLNDSLSGLASRPAHSAREGRETCGRLGCGVGTRAQRARGRGDLRSIWVRGRETGHAPLALDDKARYHGPRMHSPGLECLWLWEHASLSPGRPGERSAFLD